MKKPLNVSTVATAAGQTMTRDQHLPEETQQPGTQHNSAAFDAGTSNPTAAMTPQARMDLLRGLPSFGFEMVGDESQSEAARN
ncbi:hypothetical protein ACIQC5_19665 [Paenarthrobacter sp. NPDC092416]|uniref:hypothetical protein n=1 Tax=Paenarthrobacter sp. NPDC092416 TaxID=3364386 RepID=UPI0037F46B96